MHTDPWVWAAFGCAEASPHAVNAFSVLQIGLAKDDQLKVHGF